jgi:hypothetical protein
MLVGVLIVAEKPSGMNRLLVASSCAALIGAAVTGAYIGVVTGRLPP